MERRTRSRKISELPLTLDIHHLVDFFLSSPVPSENDDWQVLFNEYGLYPTYEAHLCLRLLRRALAGDMGSRFFLFALNSYDEDMYSAVGESFVLSCISGTDVIIFSMFK